MIIRAFDIETIPDESVWTKPENADPLKLPFPPPHAHQVVAIAWVDLQVESNNKGHQFMTVNHNSICSVNEFDLLDEWQESCRAVQSQEPLTFVSWNGRRFDGPVLAQRAMRHRIKWDWWLRASPSYRYRYSESEGHIDVMDVLADFGAAPNAKLGDFARHLGMPGKPDMAGASVVEEMGKGNIKGVKAYCLLDAAQTAGIYVTNQAQKSVITYENLDLILEDLERVTDKKYPFKGVR